MSKIGRNDPCPYLSDLTPDHEGVGPKINIEVLRAAIAPDPLLL